MVKISILGIKRPLILSPLAGITIPPFRRLCAEFGASITISEMTFARGILFQDSKSIRRIERADSEKIFGIQLLTNDPKDLLETIEYIESNRLSDFIELNLGCPKPKITNAKLGAGLLKPENLTILNDLFEIAGTTSNLPFSLKMRAGYIQTIFPKVLKLAEKNNIAFITLHARLATDKYQDLAREEYWIEASSISSIPIVANGDIWNYEQSQEVMDRLPVNGVAFGRTARGNPHIFQLKSKSTSYAAYNLLIEYMRNTSYFNLYNLRIQSADFLKNIRKAASERKRLLTITEPEKIITTTQAILKEKDDMKSST